MSAIPICDVKCMTVEGIRVFAYLGDNKNRLGMPFVWQDCVMIENEFVQSSHKEHEMVSCTHVKNLIREGAFGCGICQKCVRLLQDCSGEVEKDRQLAAAKCSKEADPNLAEYKRQIMDEEDGQ